MDDLPSCGRSSVRVLWSSIDWLSNLLFILNIEDISDGNYNNFISREPKPLVILYVLIFISKSIYWLYSFYHVIYNHGILPVRSRVLALWLLSISSSILVIIIIKLPVVQSDPLFFVIVVVHIAIITKQCFVLGSFPFNIYFQYVLALLFATDFVLMLPATNILEYDSTVSREPVAYVKFVIFMICCLFLVSITFRPISLLCEGKYPTFVKPPYRDYYDSEDGGWRNDESQIEETAISAYKTQLLRVPTPQSTKNIDYHLYGTPTDETPDDMDDEDDDVDTDMAHSLINMVSHDIILPTQEPTQFDKCFYWNLSALFIFFIHIPIIVLMSTKQFASFLRILPTNEYTDINNEELQIGIVVDILFILPTLYILGIVLTLFVFRIFDIKKCCCCSTRALFWCIFSKQYFDIIVIHRGQNDKNKEEYYSSLWSFKKKRTGSGDNTMLDGIDEKKLHGNSLSTVPKAPPMVNIPISSLPDNSQYEDDEEDFFKKKNKKHKKKVRNESINSDQSKSYDIDQELQKFKKRESLEFERKQEKSIKTEKAHKRSTSKSKSKENEEEPVAVHLSLANDSMAYLTKTSLYSISSVDKTIDHPQ